MPHMTLPRTRPPPPAPADSCRRTTRALERIPARPETPFRRPLHSWTAIPTRCLEFDRSRAYHRPTLMSGPSDGAGRSAADTTARLLARAQAGDGDAANDLFTRHMADLSRWARGRLPAWARDLTDTRDLVQDA